MVRQSNDLLSVTCAKRKGLSPFDDIPVTLRPVGDPCVMVIADTIRQDDAAAAMLTTDQRRCLRSLPNLATQEQGAEPFS